jgi:hypothetical protein
MATELSKGCWVDIFELSRFRGRRRRLVGPARHESLRSRSNDWGIVIDSLIAGPGAFVRLYSHKKPNFENTWLLPGQSIGDAVQQGLSDELDSIQILVRPPEPKQPGYEFYQRFLERTKARA